MDLDAIRQRAASDREHKDTLTVGEVAMLHDLEALLAALEEANTRIRELEDELEESYRTGGGWKDNDF